MNMNKKGQVTVFIIVGIILLLGIGLLIYIYAPAQLTRDKVLSDTVSPDSIPIKNFVESCIAQEGENAVKILGERGGYVKTIDYPPSYNEIRLSPDLADPTNADSFFITNDVAIPYWYYMNYPNDADSYSFSSKMPELKSIYDDGAKRPRDELSIEAQIDRYVQVKLARCLNNFQDFKGMTVETDLAPIATTYVTNENVIVNVYFPIRIITNGKTETVEHFGAVIPARLYNVYNLAKLITSSEAKYNFSEKHFLDMLSLNSGEENILPPMFEVDVLSGSGSEWTVEEVRDGVQSLLLQYIPLLNVEGTTNGNTIDVFPVDAATETRQKVYSNMILPVLSTGNADAITQETNLQDMEVTFSYQGWPFFLKLNDKNGYIKSTLFGNTIKVLSPLKALVKTYKTVYDISWPIMISINDPVSFSGNGYTFRFGIEGNIRANDPVSAGDFPFPQGTSYGPSICDEIQRTKDIAFNVTSCNEKNICTPVSDASVTLLSKPNCYLGTTYEDGMLYTRISPGIGLDVFVEASHPDYAEAFYAFDTDAIMQEIKMKQLKDFRFTVMKKTLSKDAEGRYTIFDDTEKPLEPGEKATMIITGLPTDDYPGTYSTSFTVDGSNSTFLGKFTEGTYTFEGMLFRSPTPEETAQEIRSLENSSQNATIISMLTQEAISNPMGPPSGGLKLTENTSVSFFREDTINNSELKLYVLELKDLNMSEPDDMNAYASLDQFTTDHFTELMPKPQ